MNELRPAPISAASFARFGHVIEARGEAQPVNAGSALRHDALAPVELVEPQARATLSIFRAVATPLPCMLRVLERHVLGSQAFVPMAAQRFVAVVAPDLGGKPDTRRMQAFLCNGAQGVSYAPATWHHPLIALDAGDFLVVDRVGNDGDCEEWALDRHQVTLVA